MNVGSAVKRLRTERKMSINRLAAKSGIAKSQISDLEKGKQRNPTLDTIIRLSIGLDAHIAEVLSLRLDNAPAYMLANPLSDDLTAAKDGEGNAR
jgi:transcriptional regulator with XRE-family HTH domain